MSAGPRGRLQHLERPDLWELPGSISLLLFMLAVWLVSTFVQSVSQMSASKWWQSLSATTLLWPYQRRWCCWWQCCDYAVQMKRSAQLWQRDFLYSPHALYSLAWRLRLFGHGRWYPTMTGRPTVMGLISVGATVLLGPIKPVSL